MYSKLLLESSFYKIFCFYYLDPVLVKIKGNLLSDSMVLYGKWISIVL